MRPSQDLHLRAEGSVQISSRNDTSLHSPRGILLSGSAPRNDDDDGGGGAGTPSAGHKENPSLDAARLGGKGHNSLGPGQEGGGHVLLAPGAGSGVGIGRGFSSQHLASAAAGMRDALILVYHGIPSSCVFSGENHTHTCRCFACGTAESRLWHGRKRNPQLLTLALCVRAPIRRRDAPRLS